MARDENGNSILVENMTYEEWYKWKTGKSLSDDKKPKSKPINSAKKPKPKSEPAKKTQPAKKAEPTPKKPEPIKESEPVKKSEPIVKKPELIAKKPEPIKKPETVTKKPSNKKNQPKKYDRNRTAYTMKELQGKNRQQLVSIARRVAKKNAHRQAITEEEALMRFDLLVDANTTAQLRKYINKWGK